MQYRSNYLLLQQALCVSYCIQEIMVQFEYFLLEIDPVSLVDNGFKEPEQFSGEWTMHAVTHSSNRSI